MQRCKSLEIRLMGVDLNLHSKKSMEFHLLKRFQLSLKRLHWNWVEVNPGGRGDLTFTRYWTDIGQIWADTLL